MLFLLDKGRDFSTVIYHQSNKGTTAPSAGHARNGLSELISLSQALARRVRAGTQMERAKNNCGISRPSAMLAPAANAEDRALKEK